MEYKIQIDFFMGQESFQLRTEAIYEKINDHEIPNEDSFDEEETNYNNTNDYMIPNKDLFNKRETDYENTNDYETPNEDSFDEVLNDEDKDFFNDEILDDYNHETQNEDSFDEVLNDEDKDFFNDEILDDDDEMLIDCNDEEPNEKGPDKVVDEALNIEQMLSINGEFAPYFKNFTEALMFFWIQKYNISTRAYEELVNIIRHPQFKNEDVANIHCQVYFGPGQIVIKNQELWHGNLWKESPRFGQASIQFNGNDKLKTTVQCVLIFKELLYNLQSNSWRKRSRNELWLLDREMDNAIIIVELQNIVRVASIIILYNENNVNISSIFIREILYKHQGYWKLKNVKY
ncbi:hypothetical protein F8M41_005597 [Gigaspora margarita]|uniref:Uncharacterized protein n=1 Tax=Gigaspora margarita TaxID=4874 RepID=A0A8H4ERI4_GIGMA|nr:hypothetical protein F8M41_005597 [Gigaspora margarita]